jgi:hypothetical protein
MQDRRVSQAELTEALQRAILHVIEELGGERAISANVFADSLVGLFLAASPPGTPVEAMVKVFRDKLEAALARADVAGHA